MIKFGHQNGANIAKKNIEVLEVLSTKYYSFTSQDLGFTTVVRNKPIRPKTFQILLIHVRPQKPVKMEKTTSTRPKKKCILFNDVIVFYTYYFYPLMQDSLML